MARIDEQRLMVKVARMYYERGLYQSDIAAQLGISQATISRVLKRASEEGIVRITVSTPIGIFPELEEQLEQAYGLKEAVVVDTVADNEEQLLRDLGAAAAYYVETTVAQGEVIGISSWSASLLAMVDAMQALPKRISTTIVQILGGVGNPAAEHHATHLIRRLAIFMNGQSVFLAAPGVTGSAESAQAFREDLFVREALARFSEVTLALVGIGAVEPSRLLASSGNVFSAAELQTLRDLGAVGDVCVRFFDVLGNPVDTPLNKRVIGMELEQLKRAKRSVGIAGGRRKLEAIRGALAGRWINVLITDRYVAEQLIQRAPTVSTPGADALSDAITATTGVLEHSHA